MSIMQPIRVAQFLIHGYFNFGLRGFNASQANFPPGTLDVDLRGKNYIVTGATSGLGRITAEELAKRGGTVHLVCRDGERGERVREGIVSSNGGDAKVHVCDLSKLSEIRAFAREWNESGMEIAALVNNAGTMVHRFETTAEGYEMGFATNSLGTFALTELLKGCLERSRARVVTVSSGGMLTEGLHLNGEFGDGLVKDGRIDGAVQYARCKRRQVALTEHWARESRNVFWASMHPGWAGTPGLEKAMPDFYKFMKNQMRSEEQGADTIVYLAIAEEVLKEKSGGFFFDRRAVRKHLWVAGTEYSEEMGEELARKLKEMLEDE